MLTFPIWSEKIILNTALLPAICWDQWFPEAARAMVLQGAEVLLYPTAIGSEPQDQNLDSREHWKRVMQGHAGANLVIPPHPPSLLLNCGEFKSQRVMHGS